MSHESSVKEWKERALQAEAMAAAYEKQIVAMNHMLEQRDGALRQAEFNQVIAEVERQGGHVPTDESPDGPPLTVVDNAEQITVDEAIEAEGDEIESTS